jgi:tetratricopeptide (TPR) repeat protein
MKLVRKVIAACSVISLTASVIAPVQGLGELKKVATTVIQGNQNIVAGGNVSIYQGLNPKQLAEYRGSIQEQDWEAAKDNPALRKLVRACHGGKDVEQLDAYSKATFWEDLSNYLNRFVQADADAQKLFQQGNVGAELKALIPKIEAARNDFNYDEVNRLLSGFRGSNQGLEQDLAKVNFLQGQNFELQVNYPEAERYYRKAAAIDDENPIYLNAHAVILNTLGRYAEAEPLFRRALANFEKNLGPEHPSVATSLNNLARLLQNLGRYTEAEPLHRRALAINEKALGAEHLVVASTLNHLASLLEAQGKYGEAELLYRRVLAITEKVWGPQHPDVVISLNNLACLLGAQGKYAEAESLYRRALAINEKALGTQHPDVARILNNLAHLLHDMGKGNEAELLYRRALAIYEKVLGPQHPDVATILNNLAQLLQDMGKFAEAETLYRRALMIQEISLGPYHPVVAITLTNLAGLLCVQGKFDDAEPLFRRALAIDEMTLGPEHPNSISCKNYLNAVQAKKKQ